MINRGKINFLLLVTGDLVILYCALVLMIILRYREDSFSYIWGLHIAPFSILFFIWVLTFISLGLYEVSITKNERRFIERLAHAVITNTFIGIVIFYVIPYFQITPRANLFIILLLSSFFIFIWRYLFNSVVAKASADRVLFFGLSNDILELADYLKNNPQFAFQPVVYITTGEEKETYSVRPLYQFDHNIKDLIKKFSVQTVIISRDIADNKALVRMFFEIIPLGIRIIHFPTFYETITGKIPVSLINEAWFLAHFIHTRHYLYEKIKKFFDVVLAIIFAVPTLILFPFIALLIRMDTKGPIFYKQARIGKDGHTIEIIKFRSMIANAEKNKPQWADENDPRVTRIGSFLRKTRLDELPQLWNVLRGEMSFIGPRPERPEFVSMLEREIPFYAMRHIITPGLTGWAQINFPYGASKEDALEKLQYDLYYIKHRSFILDILILLRTIVVVFSSQGR